MWKVWLLCIRSVERKTSRLIRWMIEERTSMKVMDDVWLKRIFLKNILIFQCTFDVVVDCTIILRNSLNYHQVSDLSHPKSSSTSHNVIQNALIISHKNLHWKHEAVIIMWTYFSDCRKHLSTWNVYIWCMP
jgi:hypothetical protein